jgi:hypothetical protein
MMKFANKCRRYINGDNTRIDQKKSMLVEVRRTLKQLYLDLNDFQYSQYSIRHDSRIYDSSILYNTHYLASRYPRCRECLQIDDTCQFRLCFLPAKYPYHHGVSSFHHAVLICYYCWQKKRSASSTAHCSLSMKTKLEEK